jgi:hypothetical protein
MGLGLSEALPNWRRPESWRVCGTDTAERGMNTRKYLGNREHGDHSNRARELIIDAVFAAGGLLIWVCFAVLVLSHPSR